MSILNTIKTLLGLDASYDAFDTDIIVFINGALATLIQIGVGPTEGFAILGSTETWEDFLGSPLRLNSAITYVYMKVKLAFDPPSNSSVLSAYKETCSELEWRLSVASDPHE